MSCCDSSTLQHLFGRRGERSGDITSSHPLPPGAYFLINSSNAAQIAEINRWTSGAVKRQLFCPLAGQMTVRRQKAAYTCHRLCGCLPLTGRQLLDAQSLSQQAQNHNDAHEAGRHEQDGRREAEHGEQQHNLQRGAQALGAGPDLGASRNEFVEALM